MFPSSPEPGPDCAQADLRGFHEVAARQEPEAARRAPAAHGEVPGAAAQGADANRHLVFITLSIFNNLDYLVLLMQIYGLDANLYLVFK